MNTTSSSAKRADPVSNTSTRPPRLLDLLRERIRYKHYSLRTEQAYVHWVRAFIRQQGMRHPRDMGAAEVEQFMCWLANGRNVAPSTHNQALSALLFLYREVLDVDFPWMNEIGRPKKRERVPVVFSRPEVSRLLGIIDGIEGELARLLYGTGMRLMEGLRLRVKDLDFDRNEIVVREGKGGKDRALMLPESLAADLREQLARARAWWLKDQAEGRSGVALPAALERKYPRAGHSSASLVRNRPAPRRLRHSNRAGPARPL